MLNFKVNDGRCNRCGLCALDCPAYIVEQEGDSLPFVSAENEEKCLECQHCLAVCPTGAISVFGLNPDESLPLSADVWPTVDQMTRLVRGRRSVRKYTDRNVDPKLIAELLATTANSPTGVNNRMLTFTVVDDKEQLHRLREKVLAALVKADSEHRIPERFAYVQNAISAHVEHHLDVIFRGAPHVLIVSAPPQSPCATEDVPIALAYFELLAQSAGLGTVWCGLLRLAFESAPELKSLVGLPPGHHYYAMLFGYPAIHHARTVQRDAAAKVRRVTID